MKCSHCGGTGQEPQSGLEAMTNGIPRSVLLALRRCPKLGTVPRLATSQFWAAEYAATPDVSHDEELLKAEAWLVANPSRAPHKDMARFVHNWLARAQQREAESG